jgi:hypothetical protein
MKGKTTSETRLGNLSVFSFSEATVFNDAVWIGLDGSIEVFQIKKKIIN